MNSVEDKQLRSFYLGKSSEEERLQIEQQLLVDPVVLLDFLDLKRQLEGAETIPQKPSDFLWRKLSPAFSTPKRKAIAIGFSLLAAASICFFAFSMLIKPKLVVDSDSGASSGKRILFDSNFEQPVSSGVF